jgi:outer membrane immunogenic protein
VNKILSAVTLLTLGFAVPAAAADMPARAYKAPVAVPAPVYDWTGFYIGANAGGASSHNCWDATTAAGVFFANEGCHNATGAVAGGQIGYRWQTSSFVFGLEAQGDWANLRGSNDSLLLPGFFTNVSRVDGIGLFTGQIGWAWNSVLLYAKGGAAVVADRFHVETTAGAVLAALEVKDTRWGGTVGAGVEFGFAPNWSVGAEYNHLFLQDRTVSFTDAVFGVFFGADRIHQDVDMVTLRLNYRFGGPVVARY